MRLRGLAIALGLTILPGHVLAHGFNDFPGPHRHAGAVQGATREVGLPLPFNVHQWEGTGAWYMEPYYRPTFADPGTMHEVGFLVKGFVFYAD